MHQRQLCVGDANRHPFLASFDSLSGIVNPVVISSWVTGRDIVGHGRHKKKVVWGAVQYREEVNSKVATHLNTKQSQQCATYCLCFFLNSATSPVWSIKLVTFVVYIHDGT